MSHRSCCSMGRRAGLCVRRGCTKSTADKGVDCPGCKTTRYCSQNASSEARRSIVCYVIGHRCWIMPGDVTEHGGQESRARAGRTLYSGRRWMMGRS
ncbi:hypothetical protein K466DRAFT_149713 [Polyporus arcularius HHB13444]|uniref:Uncharacterized protein n=1 Tax=Polyporus arcularius HHB13444 TaxID=1314778 RepID=A0A5C3PB54_9APHY|nr:hypothetical protein K466DRAFT_149713 [Polyporus arcularius HHB13444]